MRCALIYNPVAGVRRERRVDEIGRAVTRLRSLGYEADATPTTGPGSATMLARDAVRGGAEVVFACGGDGTVHEVLQGLVNEAGPGALGILPLGSANALARHLRLPLDVGEAVEQQIRGERQTIALGKAEIGGDVRYFAVMAGAGPDGALVHEMQSGAKSRLGRLAYYLQAARLFGTRKFEPFHVEYVDPDGAVRTMHAVAVMAARVGSLGGLFARLVEPGVQTEGQRFMVSLLRPPSVVSLPLWFLSGWLGWKQLNPFLLEVVARRVTCTPLRNNDVHCEADGEWLGCVPIKLSVVPDALTVLLPRLGSGLR